MSFLLKGKLTDAKLSYYTIKVFDKDLLRDDLLRSSITLDDGTFSITFTKEDFKRPGEFWESPSNEPELYLKIFDRDGHETTLAKFRTSGDS
jgi:hypothetical protein